MSYSIHMEREITQTLPTQTPPLTLRMDNTQKERLTSALKILQSVDFDAKGTSDDYQQTPAYACGYAASAIEGVLIELLKSEVN